MWRDRRSRRLEVELERLAKIGERLVFGLALTGDAYLQALGNVPITFTPDARREMALHVLLLLRPSRWTYMCRSIAVYPSSPSFARAAASSAPARSRAAMPSSPSTFLVFSLMKSVRRLPAERFPCGGPHPCPSPVRRGEERAGDDPER